MEISFGGLAGDMTLRPGNSKTEIDFIKECERQIMNGGRIRFIVENAKDKMTMEYMTRKKYPQPIKV